MSDSRRAGEVAQDENKEYAVHAVCRKGCDLAD